MNEIYRGWNIQNATIASSMIASMGDWRLYYSDGLKTFMLENVEDYSNELLSAKNIEDAIDIAEEKFLDDKKIQAEE